MPRHRRPVLSHSHFEPRQSAMLVVVIMPELEPLLQQDLEPGTEVAGTPPLDLQDPIDRTQGVRDTLLLLDPLQFPGVVALAPVGRATALRNPAATTGYGDELLKNTSLVATNHCGEMTL